MSRRYCTCDERYGIVPEFHDCQYTMARNRLIPIAEGIALSQSIKENKQIDSRLFNYIFNKEMNRLAIERGLFA